MSGLTTRELLYLEDVCNIFETIAKNCDFAAAGAVDQNLKSHLQYVSNEHKQWISATASIINNNKLQ